MLMLISTVPRYFLNQLYGVDNLLPMATVAQLIMAGAARINPLGSHETHPQARPWLVEIEMLLLGHITFQCTWPKRCTPEEET